MLGHDRAPSEVQAVCLRVLSRTGKETAAGGTHALTLNAQHHDGIRLDSLEGLVQIEGDITGPVVHADGQQGGRGHEGDMSAQGGHQIDIGAGHPGVEDITDDNDLRPAQVPSRGLESRLRRYRRARTSGAESSHPGVLRRVLVGAVARIEHGHVDPTGMCQQMGGSARGVADDDRIGAHGHDRLGGVLEGLALGYRRPLGGEVDDIRAQPLGGRSKDRRVRVESSKKRLTMVLPRRVGSFLTA